MSAKNELWQLRGDAWRNRSLSGNAVKLLLNLTDRHWRTLRHGEEFSLSAPQAAQIVGLVDDEAGARLIQELTRHAYLGPRGLRGCPPTNWFVFLSSIHRSRPAIEHRQQPANDDREKPANNHRQGPAHLISNSLREEMNKTMRKKSAPAPKETKGEGSGSLRSQELEKMKKMRNDLRAEYGI